MSNRISSRSITSQHYEEEKNKTFKSRRSRFIYKWKVEKWTIQYIYLDEGNLQLEFSLML